MLDRLPIDYVIVYAPEKNCPFARGLDDVLHREATFTSDVERIELFGVIRKISRTGARSIPHAATGWYRLKHSTTSSFDQSRRRMNMTNTGRRVAS